MITYGSTTLTSYNTITKIEVYYYKSTSSTSLAGGSWSTTKPTWENGKYIWQKIRTTYEGKLENGLYYSESDPVNITGQQGQTGTAAYSYKLNASDTSITVSKDGTYSKTSVTFFATSKQGTGAVSAYAGRFKIETTANGTTWTTQYTSSTNESSKEYTIPTGVLNIRCSLYQAGGTSVLLDIVSVAIVTDGKDGTNGTNGLNNARVILYRRFSAAPSGTDVAPTGNVTYTFSTGVAANNLNSWTQNIPTGTDPVYMIAASASNTGTTDTIAKTEWSTPIKILENGQSGTNGVDGYNQATIYLYQRKSGTAPAKPSSAVTYTFSTGALSSTPSGWSRTIPANDGNPCYVTTATAIAKTATYSIAASAWSAVVVLSENGTSITITSTTVKYQKGTSGTTKPTGTWGTSIPSIGENEFLWTQTIVNYSDGSKTEAYSVSRNAKNGTSPTVSSTTVEYQQSTGGTTPPTGTWSTTAPSATAGQYMWTKTTITYSDGKTAVSYSVSKNGANGIDGIDGTSQNLLLDVYATSLDKVKAPWARYLSDSGNTTITGQFIAESNLPDPNATHFYRITDSSASTKSRGLCFYSGGTPPFLDGHTYRIGCWVRNHAGQPKLFIYVSGLGTWSSYKLITSSEWQWVECVHTFGNLDPTINSLNSTYKRLYFYFYNNNVEGSSLDMCGFKVEEVQTDISTARNILLKTEKLEGWEVQNGATISDGTVAFPEVTENTTRRIYSPNFKYELIRNQNVIFSVRVKGEAGKICACNIYISLKSTESDIGSLKWCNNYVYFTGTGEWKTICIAAPITDEWFYSGTGSPDYDNCWAGVGIEALSSYHNGFQLKQPQLSLGTTATAWSAAPEDVEASMQEKVDNIEIGGRNLLLKSDRKGSNTYYNIITYKLSDKGQELQEGDIVTFSMKARILPERKRWAIYNSGSSLNISGWQAITPDGNSDVIYTWTGEWKVNHNGSPVANTQLYVYFGTGSGTENNTIYWAKLERGNKATDWTPAPEDTDANIQQVQDNLDNLEIGGRNLIPNSKNLQSFTIEHTERVAATYLEDSCTIVNIYGNSRYGIYYNIEVEPNVTYTFSFYASNISGTNTNYAIGNRTPGQTASWSDITKGYQQLIEGKTVYTFTVPDTITVIRIYFCAGSLNGTCTIKNVKLEKGNRATDWTPAPEDIQADIDTVQDLATAVYGTCSTGATTVDKVVTCSNFTLFDGARIQITFTNANTAVASETTTASPTLNINGTGRKSIKIGIEEANTTNPLYWAAGATIEFVYDGSAWVLQNAPYTLYGTCNTEENVREKQVVCDGAVICKGTTIYVDMLYSNTADSNSENGNVTLNVANTIAKTIYANNSTLTIRSRYNWNAGENPSFTFDGQYWQMDKDTVPAYITDKDEDGIFVHPINDTVSGWSIGKVFELLNNGYSYIKMWLEDVTDNLSAKIRIGREDQHHILLDKEIIQFKKGNTPEELASFSSSGISFDEGVPFKIGNDSTYVQFVDNNSDGVADALEIVADKISFKNGGNNTVQDIQERFNDLQTDISNITNNIEINPTADTPYVAITTQKNEYNAGLKLEPTQLSFQLNGQTTATIANDEMNIPTASVTNLFMQSANQSYEKIWVMRSNGHLSLKVGKQN